MSPEEWAKIKYFSAGEFDSKDVPGSGATAMQWSFVSALDRLRRDWGLPLSINSGYRSPSRNAAVGGKSNSAHLRGLAADIKMSDLRECIKFAIFAGQHGFDRIGVDLAGKYVHIDLDDSLPSPAVWFYSA